MSSENILFYLSNKSAIKYKDSPTQFIFFPTFFNGNVTLTWKTLVSKFYGKVLCVLIYWLLFHLIIGKNYVCYWDFNSKLEFTDFFPLSFSLNKKNFSRKKTDVENKYNLPIVRSLEVVMKINPLNNGFWIPCWLWCVGGFCLEKYVI